MSDEGPVQVDGSRGEGGGQILRSSLTLSILTGRPVRFTNLRAGRPKPGLRPQHRASLRAAAKICRAEVDGDRIGSQEVFFRPGEVKPGTYRLEIPTAGSACLVLQTVALPLAMAKGRSIVDVVGGTHVPWSPSATYLSELWAPWMADIGLPLEVTPGEPGFYPQGGGDVRLRTEGGGVPRPWEAPERGELLEVRGVVTLAQLPVPIGKRIIVSVLNPLEKRGLKPLLRISKQPRAPAAGVAIDLVARFEGGVFATTALGRKGRRSEELGAEVVEDLLRFLDGEGTVDPHLADQAILPLALAAGTSRFRTSEATRHLHTNAGTVALFLGERVEIAGEIGEESEVTVRGGEA